MKKFEKVALSAFIDFKNGKKRPSANGVIPVYGGNGILSYTTQSNYENTVIIGRVGAYCGSVYYSPNRCWVSDNAIAAISKENSNIVFVYYLLKDLRLNNYHIGTSQPLLTQETLKQIEVCLPPLFVQNKIAEILGVFDRKIQINKEVNDNLAVKYQGRKRRVRRT